MKKAFTLIELLAVVAVFVIVGAIILSSGSCSNKEKADKAVDEYVANLYPGWTVEGKVTKDFDSNGDGYVSSDVRIKNATTGEEKTLALDCAKAMSFNTGCKQRTLSIGQ